MLIGSRNHSILADQYKGGMIASTDAAVAKITSVGSIPARCRDKWLSGELHCAQSSRESVFTNGPA
jgi:hypothetical protein